MPWLFDGEAILNFRYSLVSLHSTGCPSQYLIISNRGPDTLKEKVVALPELEQLLEAIIYSHRRCLFQFWFYGFGEVCVAGWGGILHCPACSAFVAWLFT